MDFENPIGLVRKRAGKSDDGRTMSSLLESMAGWHLQGPVESRVGVDNLILSDCHRAWLAMRLQATWNLFSG